tara:strand:- start:1789 stop:2220 length:432 start_codon:yes stop_codon:yes gene_type:complete
MSAHSRNKGASYERELGRLFEEHLGVPRPQRILDQTREADLGDLLVGELFLIEAKRYASSPGGWYQPTWWKQCCRAAAKQNLIPVLCYRLDRLPTRMVFPMFALNTDWCVDLGQYTWPVEGNAMMPVVCEQEVGLSIMREWIV